MNTFLFIIALIISVAVAIVFLNEIKSNEKPKPLVHNIRSIARGITVFFISVAIEDKFNLIDFGMYSGTYFLMGIVCTASYILCEVSKKHKNLPFAYAVKTIIVAFILELTLFNIPSYRTWFGDYEEITYTAENAEISSGGTYRPETQDIVNNRDEELVIRFKDINRPISTVYADVYLENGTRAVEFAIDASDETQSYTPRDRIAKSIISRKQPHSQYMLCELSGSIGELAVRLKPQNGGTVYVRNIIINLPVNMEISWIRFLAIALLSILVNAIIKGSFMQKSMSDNLKFCRIFVACVTVFACLWAVWVTNYRIDDRTWKEEFAKTEGNQVTQQLVDAFEDGRTYLVEEPNEALNSFDNPYDTQHRNAQLSWDGYNADKYAWDHVYFNEKFYSYYGIAPVILMFLPYHLATGYYFPDSAAVLIFSIIGIIGLSFLFISLIKKFFPALPTGIFIASFIIIQMASGIWYSIGRPNFYEIAMSAGFAFTTWAFYFLISGNIIGSGKISLPKTAVSSLLFALAVLSRPTTVLYCICGAVFMMCAVPKFRNTNTGKGKNKNKNQSQKLFNKKSIIYLACAIVPMACLGIVQMCYNYARFKSPFEFGIQYSLTINDFRNTQYHWRLSLIPLWNYLFNPPTISTQYPFISAEFQDMGVGGFFYSDHLATHNVCGLFFLAVPMFAYALSGKALRAIPDRRERIKKASYVFFPCVLIPLIIICSVWESGYAIRYNADFAWHMLIGAYAVIFFLYLKNQTESKRKVLNIFFCVAMVWAVVAGSVQIVNQAFRFCDYHYDYPEIAYEVEKILMFWK
ncbi:MAG: hypothetical protein NC177_07320 [Ruminococcus flavefaciens]|nr:hypothetical protein [Ruminococcus flavefaciens]